MRSLVAVLLLAACGAASGESLRPWKGGPAPALELADTEGALHRLADYRGKTVLVNFWATWCGPCRAEMPSMERLRQAMAGRPFALLAVNVGESARTASDFARQLPVAFTVLLDRDGKTTRAWGARVLPASFLVGPDGAIRYSVFGDLDWSSQEVRGRIESLMRGDESQRAAR